MFTGIIESVGVVSRVSGSDAGMRFRIDSDDFGALPLGSSVSVDGACLTVVDSAQGWFDVELVMETLERTSLSSAREGSAVNLERAMIATGRFDGHIVQGHVDGVGRITKVDREGTGWRFAISAPSAVAAYLVEKGSVTVQGVSLTVARIDGADFEVALIPHTMEVTTMGSLQPGDQVNLEADILAKYVERLLSRVDT